MNSAALRPRGPEVAVGPSSSRAVAADGVAAGLLTVARVALSFVVAVVVTRTLGAEVRGEVVYLVACAAVVAMVGSAGITPATSRARLVSPASSMLSPVVVVTTVRVLGVGGIAAGLWWVVVGPVGPLSDVQRGGLVAALALVVALQTTVAGVAGVSGRSVLVSATYAAGTAVLVLGVALVAEWDRLGIVAVLILWIVTSSGGVLLVAGVLGDRRPAAPASLLLRWSLRASWGELALSVAWRADVLLIGTVLGSEELARYSAAVAVAEVSLAVITGVRFALLRMQFACVRDAAAAAVKLTLLAAAPFVLFAATIGQRFILWTFGPEFDDLQLVLLALLPGTLALGVSYIFFDQLTGIGRTGLMTGAGLSALGVNLAANLVLMPRWGITGAAVASTLSYGLAAGWLWLGLTRSASATRPATVSA